MEFREKMQIFDFPALQNEEYGKNISVSFFFEIMVLGKKQTIIYL